jgi:hypothetical protein
MLLADTHLWKTMHELKKLCLMENWYGELASKLSKELKLIDKRMQATVHAKGIGVTEHQCKFQFNKSPIPFMCGCYRILLQFIISLCTSMYELLCGLQYTDWRPQNKWHKTKNQEDGTTYTYEYIWLPMMYVSLTHSVCTGAGTN